MTRTFRILGLTSVGRGGGGGPAVPVSVVTKENYRGFVLYYIGNSFKEDKSLI